MGWSDAWEIIKLAVSVVLFISGIIFLFKRLKPSINRLVQRSQETRHLPKNERSDAMRATRDALLEQHLSLGLYKNFFSTLFLTLLTIPFTILLGWIVVRGALRGVHFWPFYVLLACAVFMLPIFIMTLTDLLRIIIKKRRNK